MVGCDGVTCFPSHLIFFRLHSSQALVTLRLFCMGIKLLFDCSPVGASSAGVPDFESMPCWSPACHCESSSGSSFGDASGLCIEVLPLSTIRGLYDLADLWLSKLCASSFALRLQKHLLVGCGTPFIRFKWRCTTWIKRRRRSGWINLVSPFHVFGATIKEIW